MSFLSFTIGQLSLTVFLDGTFSTIDHSHANYPMLLEELKKPADQRDLEAIRECITIKKLIEKMAIGKVTVFEGEVHYDGVPVVSYMTGRMLQMMSEGFDIAPWARFMDNVYENPAEYARTELYEWMEKADMPITPDGCFLAFKKVNGNYMDCHTGTFNNSVGCVLEMPREACDPVRDNHCSTGFHFASSGYLRNFGGSRVMVVKINPRDVTSIPSDYKFTKGRTCKYEVVSELTSESAAYNACWKTGLVDIEDPQEFPDDIVKQLVPAKPKLPKAKTVLEQLADREALDPRDPFSKLLEANGETLEGVAQIEAEMTDAGKADPEDWGAIPEKYMIGVPQETLAKSINEDTASISFTTTDGRTFTQGQIMTAVGLGSKRDAARRLGIGESTLRGWLKKITE